MDDDALCPGCRKPATRVLPPGNWRWRCDPCAWEWGHPQITTYDEAVSALHNARVSVSATGDK